MKKLLQIFILFSFMLLELNYSKIEKYTIEIETYNSEKKTTWYYLLDPIEMISEDIEEEIKYGDMELVAQLIQAEAGNQDLKGKRLVADVVYNRVRDPKFPNTVEEVIFQSGQFSVIKNGSFEKAGWKIDEDSFKASEMEYDTQLNSGILYFNNNKKVRGKNIFKYGGHWFGY